MATKPNAFDVTVRFRLAPSITEEQAKAIIVAELQARWADEDAVVLSCVEASLDEADEKFAKRNKVALALAKADGWVTTESGYDFVNNSDNPRARRWLRDADAVIAALEEG